MIRLVAADDFGHTLGANRPVSYHNDPAWFSARAICGALFHGVVQFYQSLRGICNPNFAFLTKIIVGHCLTNPTNGTPSDLDKL
jgi:hypothetical protein